ncbi:tryptophan--tRNA ligase, mitochondrial [Colletotrichum liriopes]|uniref:tryptophan--tRNA ligase n=1 Tax=Colletotrichum liriopes TaxID=708192 RepID=A0AA37LW03_9PEZI|nr:tryptophan--tRNA ligase, mitochondrial [Colletotrichum liriopes]
MWRHARPAARRLRTSDGRRAASTEKQKVIFSGIQPTGTPHLGNYAGAIRQWVHLQSEPADGCKLIYSVVDLHAITVPQQAKQLRQWKRETLAALLATGISPERSTLFYQSSVRYVLDLAIQATLLVHACPTTKRKTIESPRHTNTSPLDFTHLSPGRSKLHAYNSNAGSSSLRTHVDPELHSFYGLLIPYDAVEATRSLQSKLSLSSDATILDEGAKASLKLGLFSYPVLQAADILVHRPFSATHVPVGDDQRQHLEFARECVTNFNHNFGPHLVPQRPSHLPPGGQKMSKSATDPRSRILITDTPEEIHQKIMSARTDSSNHVSYDPINRPGVSNLMEILSMFDAQGRTPSQLAKTLSQASLKDLKQTVSAVVVQGLDGIRERYFHFLSADEGKYLDAVEAQGANKARLSAEETMAVVREATGL